MERFVGGVYTEYISTREWPFIEAAAPSALAYRNAGTQNPNDAHSIHASVTLRPSFRNPAFPGSTYKTATGLQHV